MRPAEVTFLPIDRGVTTLVLATRAAAVAYTKAEKFLTKRPSVTLLYSASYTLEVVKAEVGAALDLGAATRLLTLLLALAMRLAVPGVMLG